jgi:hypothetical protein
VEPCGYFAVLRYKAALLQHTIGFIIIIKTYSIFP